MSTSTCHKTDQTVFTNYDDIPVTFGIPELASLLGISRSKAYELANRHYFPTFRINKRIIISKKHFIEWIEEQYAD